MVVCFARSLTISYVAYFKKISVVYLHQREGKIDIKPYTNPPG